LTDIEEAQGLKNRIEVSTPPGIPWSRHPSEVQIVFPPGMSSPRKIFGTDGVPSGTANIEPVNR